MRITLLGTGSADGWPNPFCDCTSCQVERRAGRSRRPSSALVDDEILIDCGPAATHAAITSGRSLRALRHVLITHGHPDHLDPAFLLTRHWAHATEILHVWGPGHALNLCRDWIAPGAPIEFHVVTPGDRVTLDARVGDYELLVLAAAHSSADGDRLADEAVLFDLTSADGGRLLYATDTGILPESTIANIGSAVDVLIIDETFGDMTDHGTGHLDLVTLPATLTLLCAAGVVTTRTQVVATHLSHHNPPTPVLRQRLREIGVRLAEDLDIIDTRQAPMASPRRLLVLGGARSGKSTHAERIVERWGGRVTYVATGGTRADDPDWAKRVAGHRSRRPAEWTTVETLDVAAVLAAAEVGEVVLVDCMTLWLTRLLDGIDAWARDERGEAAEVAADVMVAVADLSEAMQASRADVILVSNEVGWGVVPATPSGRLFRDVMGRVNSEFARACEETTIVVAGRSLPTRELDWP